MHSCTHVIYLFTVTVTNGICSITFSKVCDVLFVNHCIVFECVCVCVCVCVWAVYGTDIGELSNIRNVPQIKISILLYSIMTWLVPLLSYTVRSSTHSIHATYMMNSIHDTWYHLQLWSHLRAYFYTLTLLIFLSVFQSSLSTFSNPRKEYRHLLNVYIMLYVCVLKCKGVCVCVCVSGS